MRRGKFGGSILSLMLNGHPRSPGRLGARCSRSCSSGRIYGLGTHGVAYEVVGYDKESQRLQVVKR